ncbi:MAG: response regulator transcription factor [Bacteroidales bacterium]|nr:response regulator transcription factor [Bacteroidales bacterium]
MINIVIVEDLPLVLEGIKVLLDQEDQFNIVRTFSDGDVLLNQLKYIEGKVDVVITDIEMPGINGIQLTQAISDNFPSIKTIALSMYDNVEYYNQMIAAGAKGFVLKQKHYKELKEAINRVTNEEFYFSSEILQHVIGKMTNDSAPEDRPNIKLSQREIQLIKHISEGLLNKEIADKMNLSLRSVESLKSRLMDKTDTRDNASLLMWGIKNQLIDI